MIGITRNDPARNRWSITYNERASLAEDTRSLFGLTHDDDDDEETHKDCLQSRIKRDNHDVIQLVDQFQRYNVFQQEHMYDLVSLTTGDVASEEILNDLTHAAESGKKNITELVKNRLGTTNTASPVSPVSQRENRKHSQAYTAQIPSLNNSDPTGAKETELSPSVMRTCTIIDGMALVRAMGKPHNASTFGEYADVFTQRVASNLHGNVTRVDIVFDRYQQNSIKSGTRTKRSTTQRKVRTIVSRDVKLPANWNSFIEMDENKANLTHFLSTELENHVQLYDEEISTSNSIQEVRCALFRKLKANVDTLPPTEDALSMHLKRAHYQTKVWKQSLVTHPQLPSPINCGWQMMNGMLVPMLLTKEPVQSTCVQLTVCGCKESGSQCSTRQCLCRRRGLYCSGACGCARAAWCMNSNDIQETNGEETDLDLDVVVRPEKSTSTTRSSVCDAQPSTSARVLRAQGRTDRRL
ncbi:hypothetical protein F7725_022347 [Dissostichus mawsoni]|uniref:Tesmin/TSO1-like CXC domain-containing protein n=1 Tax=Dissostichus mawsoni TaxID=36200 RepID=A0A7J5YXI9_DISMA|nr:hypothetical protein F7725_022347 [Dissostichus mawsoni]